MKRILQPPKASELEATESDAAEQERLIGLGDFEDTMSRLSIERLLLRKYASF